MKAGSPGGGQCIAPRLAEVCDSPKRGELGRVIFDSGGLRSRYPPTIEGNDEWMHCHSMVSCTFCTLGWMYFILFSNPLYETPPPRLCLILGVSVMLWQRSTLGLKKMQPSSLPSWLQCWTTSPRKGPLLLIAWSTSGFKACDVPCHSYTSWMTRLI